MQIKASDPGSQNVLRSAFPQMILASLEDERVDI